MEIKRITYLIFILGGLLVSLSSFTKRPIWHGLLGGSYIFESHFNENLQGFEINLNRHYSCCVSSTYLNSFGVNYLTNNDYNEIGLSYSSTMFKNISGGGHGGWNLMYKINPNVVNYNSDYVYMVKPGIGATVYTGARTRFLTLQVFALYNYNIYFQKEQHFTGTNNHSFQIGVFVGFNAFEMRPSNRRKKTNENEDE